MLDPLILKNGEEQFEEYFSKISKKILFQYDYRDIDGKLFSCVAKTKEEAKEKRDEWLNKKSLANS